MKTRATYLGPQYGLKGEFRYALVGVECDEGITHVAYNPEKHSLSSSDHLQILRDKRKQQDSTEAIYSVLDALQNLGRVWN